MVTFFSLLDHWSLDNLAFPPAVVYVDEEYYEEQEKNPNWHPFFQILSINKTRLRPCHKEYSLYTYGPKYYTLASGYHPGILPNCDSQGHNG